MDTMLLGRSNTSAHTPLSHSKEGYTHALLRRTMVRYRQTQGDTFHHLFPYSCRMSSRSD